MIFWPMGTTDRNNISAHADPTVSHTHHEMVPHVLRSQPLIKLQDKSFEAQTSRPRLHRDPLGLAIQSPIEDVGPRRTPTDLGIAIGFVQVDTDQGDT